MSNSVNTAPLKVGMRVVVRHKFAKDVLPKPGGPIESTISFLPGKIVETRIKTGRDEFRVEFDQPHPTGQEWFWRGIIYPENQAP